jgi:hypothetical protein
LLVILILLLLIILLLFIIVDGLLELFVLEIGETHFTFFICLHFAVQSENIFKQFGHCKGDWIPLHFFLCRFKDDLNVI